MFHLTCLGCSPTAARFSPWPGTPRYLSHKAYHETSQNEKNSLHFGNCLRNFLAILASFYESSLKFPWIFPTIFPSFPRENSPESHCSNCLCGQQRSWWSSMRSQIGSFPPNISGWFFLEKYFCFKVTNPQPVFDLKFWNYTLFPVHLKTWNRISLLIVFTPVFVNQPWDLIVPSRSTGPFATPRV